MDSDPKWGSLYWSWQVQLRSILMCSILMSDLDLNMVDPYVLDLYVLTP